MTSRLQTRAAPMALVLFLCLASAAQAHAPDKPPAERVAPGPTGDAVHGGQLYQGCMGCHSLDENDVGPKHRGVVGRPAASVPGYAYSKALKASGITWTPAMLDKWLTNPQVLVPGAKMYFSIAKPQDRADIIAYLAKQK